MSTALASRIVQEHAKIASALPAEVVRLDKRRKAIDALAAAGLPTPRDENWKYANLRSLEQVRFAPTSPRNGEVNPELVLPPPIGDYARYVFIDGVFAPHLSADAQTRIGVTVRALRSGAGPAPPTSGSADVQGEPSNVRPALSHPTMGHVGTVAPFHAASPAAAPDDARFVLLNEAFATDSAQVFAAAGADCPACVELVFVASADAKAGASYPRLELHVEAQARVGVIERHISYGSESNFVNVAVNVSIGQGATLDHYRVQQAGSRATWIDTLLANVSANATYRLYSVSLGAQSARSTLQVRLAGQGAQVGLHAASVADKHQTHDTFALVEHAVPNTRTEQTFRGIAAGRSRVAFNGKVVVREGANGSDSAQSLRGLLAGREAEIDVRPQLEIYTDDVRCSHGATVGKLDEMMLFYLLSRGIDRDTAERLLKWAFLEDVISKIQVPELRRQIEETLPGAMRETLISATAIETTGAGGNV